MSKWKQLIEPPETPVMVEFFSGNAPQLEDHDGNKHEHDPLRDHRRDLGYWDGKYFRHHGTGHEIHDECHGQPEWLPTHYRALIQVPEPKKRGKK